MQVYDTVTEALRDLKERGFTTDFNLAFDQIKCAKTGVCLSPAQFEVVEHYRFEGMSNPDDEEVVYAVASKDGTLKGVLVNAYGTYGDRLNDELIKKLSVQQ